jgi:hypothetical protein
MWHTDRGRKTEYRTAKQRGLTEAAGAGDAKARCIAAGVASDVDVWGRPSGDGGMWPLETRGEGHTICDSGAVNDEASCCGGAGEEGEGVHDGTSSSGGAGGENGVSEAAGAGAAKARCIAAGVARDVDAGGRPTGDVGMSPLEA